MPRRRFKIGRYLKALVAFLAPALLQLQQALTNGVSFTEGSRAVLNGLITAMVVWAVPNDQT